jgi:uncharacterized repeat protein (TIGR04076 family)
VAATGPVFNGPDECEMGLPTGTAFGLESDGFTRTGFAAACGSAVAAASPTVEACAFGNKPGICDALNHC